MNFTLGHLGFFVTDLERSLDFYCNKLGFREMFTQKFPGTEITNVYLWIAPNQFLELFGNMDVHQAEGISYGHMCLHTQDIYATRQELLEKGIDVTEIRKGSSQSLMCNIKDPDGNSIEISQLLPESLQFIHDHP